MKKLLIIVLTVILCLTLTACSEKDVVTGFDGTPALNLNTVDEHITRVELSIDNWKDYIKEYSYNVQIIEKDAFGEVTKSETLTVYRLGYGTEKYHCLSAVIELKHKQTGEIITFGQRLSTNIVEDIAAIRLQPFHLDEYECTRIKGYMYFIDYPEDVMEEVINVHDRWSYIYANASIAVGNDSHEGTWNVDLDAKVIRSQSDDWKEYFE